MEREWRVGFLYLRNQTVKQRREAVGRKRALAHSKPFSLVADSGSNVTQQKQISEQARVLQLLRHARAQERRIEIAEFLEEGLDYRAAIARLQRRGFKILRRPQRSRSRRRWKSSSYRLVFDPERDAK
jgi:hypothetical protein